MVARQGEELAVVGARQVALAQAGVVDPVDAERELVERAPEGAPPALAIALMPPVAI